MLWQNLTRQGIKTSSNSLLFSKSGFTLVELMVVIMIMVLVFSLGFANYRDFQRRKVLEGAAETIKGDLRFAQEASLSGQKPSTCGRSRSLNSYRLRRVTLTSYEIIARCLPGPADVVVKSASDTDISTEYPGISINPFSDVIFNVLGRGVDNAVTITLAQPSTGDTETIDITKGGEIK